MNEKIIIRECKTLKLQKVLSREVPQREILDPTRTLHMINNYVLSKNVHVTGPLINRSLASFNKDNQPTMSVKLMLQLDTSISPDFPYDFNELLIEKNCLFARFTERQKNLHFAYQKLAVYAFEHDIKLRGDNYTVFVKKDSTDLIIADIFMPTI